MGNCNELEQVVNKTNYQHQIMLSFQQAVDTICMTWLLQHTKLIICSFFPFSLNPTKAAVKQLRTERTIYSTATKI